MTRFRSVQSRLTKIFTAAGSALAVAVLVLATNGSAIVAAQSNAASGSGERLAQFAAAAQEFGVPANVLVALSYNQSHWQASAGSMSMDGGYGLMDLRTYVPQIVSGRDGTVKNIPKKDASYYTLDQAAGLLHVSPDVLKSDNQQNIRGAAAVLAETAKQLNGGTLPKDTEGWYGAIAKFGGAADTSNATSFADSIYATIKSGAALTTTDGQSLSLPAMPQVQPNRDNVSALGLAAPRTQVQPRTDLPGTNPECPTTITCRFIPAAYAQNGTSDPTDYGNYDPAHRPADMQIKYIYIHDTEGSYDSAISHFQDPTSYVSAQYVIRSSDGAVTQMVANSDVSWGVGNWYDNMHGINIENEGIAATGATWFTPAMYRTNAELVRYLATKYNIPLDRQHILGHDNISALTSARQGRQHWDPGPYWNWNYFMALVNGQTEAQATAAAAAAGTPIAGHRTGSSQLKKGEIITIAPTFATNTQTVTDCQTGTCVTLPSQGTNFVPLYTAPDPSAPLLSDPYIHTDHSAGTTRDDDWGDKAPAGFKYVVADTKGDWTAIWFAGQKAWFKNPVGRAQAAKLSWSATVSAKAGKASIPVYGGAFPEASAYPADVPVRALDELYQLPTGQRYATTAEKLPTDYFYDATVNYSLPDDHIIVHGKQKYYQISFNHRIGYVKADDVDIHWQP